MALRSARDWIHWNRPSNHDMFRLLEDYDQYREGDTSTQLSLGFGWRRQHAVTVWNAMAAVVAVAAAFEVGYCMLDKAVSDAKMRELIARCNWKESKPQ